MLSENQLVQAFDAERNGIKFPIDFEAAWRKLGYSRKDNAKRAILGKLIENEDYIIDSSIVRNRPTTVLPGSPEYAALSKAEVIYLSCDGYDHFCMLSDTPEGREERKRFIEYKKAYLASLERALLSAASSEVEALKEENAQLRQTIGATISDRLEFPYSSKQLQRDSRIVNHSHVVASIKRDFVKDKDYQEVEGQIFITEQLYTCFMVTFRSEKGADISVLPNILIIATKFFFQFQQARSKKNSRTAQSDSQYEQLSIL